MGDIADLYNMWYEQDDENYEARAADYKPINKEEQEANLLVVEQLLKNLSMLQVDASLFKVAHSGSCYIQFKDSRMGKCRVGGHDERGRYAYRWQIRTDIEKPYEDSSKGHRQFFFPATQLETAANRMRRYYSTIIRADN